jgi:hypothetical protein
MYVRNAFKYISFYPLVPTDGIILTGNSNSNGSYCCVYLVINIARWLNDYDDVIILTGNSNSNGSYCCVYWVINIARWLNDDDDDDKYDDA